LEVGFHALLDGENRFVLIFSVSSKDRDYLMRRIPVRRGYSSLLTENRKRVQLGLENHTKKCDFGK